MSRTIFTKIMVAICLTSLLSVFTGSFTKQVLANDSNTENSSQGLPGRRVGGGTRGGTVGSAESLPISTIVALVPQNSEPLTTQANPTFFFYVPKMPSPKTAEFLLQDESGQIVYQKKIELDGNSGLIKISILADDKIKSLDLGKNYDWYFGIVVDPNKRENDISVGGVIKRATNSTEVVGQLTNLDPLERVDFYTRNNLWYDAVATLGELRRSRPNDSAVQARWRELLGSLKLDDEIRQAIKWNLNTDIISQQPFLNYQVLSQQPTMVGSDSQ